MQEGKMYFLSKKRAALVLALSLLLDEEEQRTWKQGKTRLWIKRRKFKDYFTNIIDELRIEDTPSYREMMRMDWAVQRNSCRNRTADNEGPSPRWSQTHTSSRETCSRFEIPSYWRVIFIFAFPVSYKQGGCVVYSTRGLSCHLFCSWSHLHESSFYQGRVVENCS